MAYGKHRTVTNSDEDADLILNDEDPMVDGSEEPGAGPLVPPEAPPIDDGEAEPEF